MRVKFNDGSYKYACDWCKKNFTDTNEMHLSIKIGKRSGTAKPKIGNLPGWRFAKVLKPLRLNFCFPNGEGISCIDAFLVNILNTDFSYPDYAE